MKITSRKAALIAGLGLIAMVAIARLSGDSGAAPVDVDVVTAGLGTSTLLHVPQEESHGAQESGVPENQGETADESARYASDQSQATQPPQWQAITDHENATRGPEQPIPFNHRFHVTDLEISCEYCHTGTERSVSGVVPPVEVCLGCHRVAGTGLPPVMELREYADGGEREGESIPWKWVNKLPEFVQFSHQPHLRNGLACQECHGPVEEMDRVYQWASLKMGWCLECHRQPPRETDVATDHVLASISPPPQAPDQRQDGSFYPNAISSEYGKHRGPTDCAACHY